MNNDHAITACGVKVPWSERKSITGSWSETPTCEGCRKILKAAGQYSAL